MRSASRRAFPGEGARRVGAPRSVTTEGAPRAFPPTPPCPGRLPSQVQRPDGPLPARKADPMRRRDLFGAALPALALCAKPTTGAWRRTPVFLDTKHAVAGAADAEAHLERLSAFADLLAADTARRQGAAAQEVLPPDCLLDTTLEQLRARDASRWESGLVRSLDRRAMAKGLGAGPGRGRGHAARRPRSGQRRPDVSGRGLTPMGLRPWPRRGMTAASTSPGRRARPRGDLG